MLVETLAASDAATVQSLKALLDSAERHDEHVPLSDAKALQLASGRQGGYTGLVARDHDGAVVAYAHVTKSGRRLDVETVVEPSRRGERVDEQLLAHVDGGEVHLWVREPTRADVERFSALGFEPEETLLQMRRPLTDDLPAPHFVDGTRLRSFVPGRDEDEWLEVNHLAFGGHRDQGAWTRDQLNLRMAQPWFDPAGFLIAEDADGMAGFCWTKVHARPHLGEIYVIAAHPSRQGQGLGKALVLAGLQSLKARGLPMGMLYSDADNEAAVQLYAGLGFDVHHVHRTFVKRG